MLGSTIFPLIRFCFPNSIRPVLRASSLLSIPFSWPIAKQLLTSGSGQQQVWVLGRGSDGSDPARVALEGTFVS